MREHLQAIERQTGVTPQALLDAPQCPQGCEHLWRIFAELHECRAWPYGPQRITYADIDAFQRVTGTALAAWERDAIRKADAAFLKAWAERQPSHD